MKLLSQFLYVIFILTIFACSPIKVKTDYDPEANFAKYETFRWIKVTKNNLPKVIARNPLMAKRIKRSVDDELITKGYQRIERGKPDFLVAIHIGVKDKIDVTTYGYAYGRRGYWRAAAVDVDRYKEGTIVIDIIDTGQKELVWRGSGVGKFDYPSEAEDKIHQAVRKILEKFPPE